MVALLGLKEGWSFDRYRRRTEAGTPEIWRLMRLGD